MKSHVVVHSLQSNHRNFELRNRFLRHTASSHQRKLEWALTEGFSVETVLGQFSAPVLMLDTDSKRALQIPVEQLVMLPGEDIRVRLEQAHDYCLRAVRMGEFVNGFEVAYLLELLDVEGAFLCASLDLDTQGFSRALEEDDAFTLEASQRIAMFFAHAWAVKTGRVRYSS